MSSFFPKPSEPRDPPTDPDEWTVSPFVIITIFFWAGVYLYNSMSSNWNILRKKMGGGDPKRSGRRRRPGRGRPRNGAKGQVTNDTSSTSRLYSTLYHSSDIVQNFPLSSEPVVASDPSKTKKGKYLAVDCEFVGIGENGSKSALARLSIVNYFGVVIYDKYVRPNGHVTDWRTRYSGIRPGHMRGAITFEEARNDFIELTKDVILVGHAISNDLKVLQASIDRFYIRDTSTLRKFREEANTRAVGLKRLINMYVAEGAENFQRGPHDSVEDARATMLMYRMFKGDLDVQAR